ncbi:MAG: phage terminase large subunit [Endomicrobia bacterium]|nr:phage terminase large subunit [Endomicrobiia bacterium]
MNEVDLLERLVKRWVENSYKSLYYFIKVILGFKDLKYNTHYRLCKMLEGGGSNKLILLPRGSFKTTIIAIGYSLWYILFRNRDARILIVSDTFNNAVKIIFKIKNIVETNDKLKLLFGDLRGKRWREDEIDLSVRSVYSKEPSICCGTQDVTRVGQHYDVIICDDIVTDVNTQTEEQMRKTVEYFKSLYSILEPGGIMIVNGTRWSYNRYELYQYILDNLRSEFEIYVEKAIRDDGSLFFPERLGKERLAELLKLMGSYQFASQYLNNPVSPEEKVFRRYELFDDINSVLSKKLSIAITIDPAISLSNTADYTGIVVSGMDDAENIYVLDAIRVKYLPDKLIDTIFYLKKRWNADYVGIETVAFQKSLKYYLEQEELKRGTSLGLMELRADTTKTKFMRILSIQPYLERGQMKVYSRLKDLIEELDNYPKSTHDDLVDALAYQLQVLLPPLVDKDSGLVVNDEYNKYIELKKCGKAVKPPKKRAVYDEEVYYYD